MEVPTCGAARDAIRFRRPRFRRRAPGRQGAEGPSHHVARLERPRAVGGDVEGDLPDPKPGEQEEQVAHETLWVGWVGEGGQGAR